MKNKVNNKNKAFTLLELIAVISLLSVVGLIVLSTIYKSTSKVKTRLYQEQVDRIVTSGRNFGSKYIDRLPTKTDPIYVSLNELHALGYLDSSDVIDPRTKDQMAGCLKIEKKDNSYVYNYIEKHVTCETELGVYRPKFDYYEDDEQTIKLGNVLNKSIKVEVNTAYKLPVVTALDKDGNPANVTLSVTKADQAVSLMPGDNIDSSKPRTSYLAIYTATDSKGRASYLKLTINVVDTIDPVITVEGHTENFRKVYDVTNTILTAPIPTATVTDNSNENITATITSDIKNGNNLNISKIGVYNVVYKAKDSSGNASKLVMTVIVRNKQKPVIETVTGNPKNWTNKDVTLEVGNVITYSNDISKVKYSYDNGKTWTENNSKVFHSNQTVNIKIKDEYNNISDSYQVVINKIDKQVPSKPTVQLTEVVHIVTAQGEKLNNKGQWTKSNVNQKFTSTDAGGSGLLKYQVSVDKRTWKDTKNTLTATTEQSQQFYVRSLDNAGNISDVSDKFMIKIDKTPPTCTSSGGNTNWLNINDVQNQNKSVKLVGTCDRDYGTYQSGCKEDSIERTINTEINSNKETPGYVSDRAGNKTLCPANQHAHIDLTRPSNPVVKLTGGGKTLNNNGQWTNATVTQKIDSKDVGSIQSGLKQLEIKGNSWAVVASSSQQSAEQNTQYTVRSVDNAGNYSASEVKFKIMIDKTAPKITGVSNPYNNKWTGKSVVNARNYKVTLTGADQGSYQSGLAKWRYRYAKQAIKDYANSATSPFVTTPFTAQRNENVYFSLCDNAGNCSGESTSMIKIDTTDPKIKWEYKLSGAHTRYSGGKKVEKKCYTKVTYTAKCSDSGSVQSGVKSNPALTEKPTSLGNHSYTAKCVDNAGNSVSSTSKTYNICKKSVSSNCRYKECAAKACGEKTCKSWCCGKTTVEYKTTCPETQKYNTTKAGVSSCPKLSGCVLTHFALHGDSTGKNNKLLHICTYKCTKTVRKPCMKKKDEKKKCTSGKCCGYKTCATSACGNESCYHN